MPDHQCHRIHAFSICLRKVFSSFRTPAISFLQTEEFGARDHQTAATHGTADAECIEVGFCASGEGITDFSQAAGS
jgi:hypothetical protein